MIGKRINERYKLLDKVGEGGMAIVYRAKDLILDRVVAVKVLRSEFSGDDEFILRFRREAESATSLAHPNIVTIYDVGEENDLYYIVMEYVEGKTLKELIKEKAPFSIDEALSIMSQITAAIRHAHENHIIHRDIKPHNILITDNGDVKVTDFGIAMAMTSATITHTKSVLGSVHYFSPEQAKGSIANEKSDIYSLGIVLYEMVTGELPFSGESPITVALKHLQDHFTPPKQLNPDIPQSVENIICRALEKDPIQRYDSVAQMQEDLEIALEPTLVRYTPYEKTEIDDETTKVLAPIHLNQDEQPTDPAMIDQHENEMKKRKKGKKWLLALILIALLLAGGVVSALTWIPNLFYVKDVPVPDVTGMTYEEAVNVLLENDLQSERDEEYSNDVEEGHVIRQTPTADTMVKENSTVTLVVSLGKEKVTLENYVGRTKDSVERILANQPFKDIEWIAEESSENEGVILSQSPEAGEEVVPEETTLVFTYSSGPEEWMLENLIGMTREAVENYAKNVRLDVHFSEEYSNEVEKGRVISQQPSPFQQVEQGDTLNIVLSKGEQPKEDEDNDERPSDRDDKKNEKKEPITFEVSQPIEIEDGREFHVVIRFQDAKHKKGVAVNEKISNSKTYTFPLTVNPNGKASFQLYLNGEEIKNKTYTYDDAEKLE